jgi:hypothetical protein
VTSTAHAIEHLYSLGRLAIAKLYNAPAEAVARLEIAEMNLISAFGLPGTEGMETGKGVRNRIDIHPARL